MENKEQPLAIAITTNNKKKCKCCGKELPINYFNKRGTGYRNICMSCERNKPKGVAIHPANKISIIEEKYNMFVRNMVSWAKRRCGFGKHVGSKCSSALKQRLHY